MLNEERAVSSDMFVYTKKHSLTMVTAKIKFLIWI